MSNLVNPSALVTVDALLVSLRGNCPLRQYMLSKLVKGCIQSAVPCDNEISYVWNTQMYTAIQQYSVVNRYIN